MFQDSLGSLLQYPHCIIEPLNNESIRVAVLEYMEIGEDNSHGPISMWDTSEVTDMSGLFKGNTEFNADISRWDVSQVTSMENLFNGAASFNINLGKWDISRVNNMDNMFQG